MIGRCPLIPMCGEKWKRWVYNTNIWKSYRLCSVVDKDSDFFILRKICESASKNPFSWHEDYFEFAIMRSLDDEQSFSSLKNIYFTCHKLLSETSVETYLQIEIFSRCHPVCNFIQTLKTINTLYNTFLIISLV